MAAALEAALKTMKKRLAATIMQVQRTLKILQAELFAPRLKDKDESMTSCAAADAKRLRLGSDM